MGDIDAVADLQRGQCALLPQAVTETMPNSVTPMPKCASTVPQAERGRPAARAQRCSERQP